MVLEFRSLKDVFSVFRYKSLNCADGCTSNNDYIKNAQIVSPPNGLHQQKKVLPHVYYTLIHVAGGSITREPYTSHTS